MVPCCLKIIPCEEYDNLFEGYEDKEQIVGGGIGEHHVCPNDAEEANRLVSGKKLAFSEIFDEILVKRLDRFNQIL